MRSLPLRPLVPCAVLVAGVIGSLTPVQAAVTCAPDPFEKDSAAAAAPLAVGTTATRAMCQEPTPQPRTETPRDEDYFAFTATAGTGYTVEAVDVGAALVNDEFDRGGLQLRVAQLNADGTTTAIEQNRALNGDRVITPPLAAGRYIVLAYTGDTQIYPGNTMDVKTVQGSEGIYGVRLTESAPAPEVTSLTLSSPTVSGGKSVTATYTLSAPAPSGGVLVDIKSSHLYNAYPAGDAYARAGATKVSVPIATKSSSTDLRVTLTASAHVGAGRSAVLTVKR